MAEFLSNDDDFGSFSAFSVGGEGSGFTGGGEGVGFSGIACGFNDVGIEQDRMFSERVMLIYDGLHYDALAISPFEQAPEEFDQTIFGVLGDRTIGPAERLALNFAKEQQRKRKLQTLPNFTLRCGVCQMGVIGQKEAVEHAKATGHANFQEYN
ncbi:hypothetical protein V2J09_011408 [Rumex salicifolius]